MSVRKPIVLNNGQWELLQSGDLLGGLIATEVEIDFGSNLIYSKSFIIIDSNININNTIQVFTSSNPGSDRVGNDWELDMPFFTTITSNGRFILTVIFPSFSGVTGKRKIFYTILNN